MDPILLQPDKTSQGKKTSGGGRLKKASMKPKSDDDISTLEQLATSVGNLAIEPSCDKTMAISPVDPFQNLEGHLLKCSRHIQSLTSEMAKIKKALYQLKFEGFQPSLEAHDHSNEDGLLDLSNDIVTVLDLGGNMKTSDEVKQALQKYVAEHNLVPVNADNTVASFKPDSELKKLLGVKRSTKQFSVDDVHREVLKLHIKKPQEMSSSP